MIPERDTSIPMSCFLVLVCRGLGSTIIPEIITIYIQRLIFHFTFWSWRLLILFRIDVWVNWKASDLSLILKLSQIFQVFVHSRSLMDLEAITIEEHSQRFTLLGVGVIKFKELEEITIVEIFHEVCALAICSRWWWLLVTCCFRSLYSLQVDASLENLTSIYFLFDTANSD